MWPRWYITTEGAHPEGTPHHMQLAKTLGRPPVGSTGNQRPPPQTGSSKTILSVSPERQERSQKSVPLSA